MSHPTQEHVVQPVSAAVVGLRAAATTAVDLGYGGLADALEDLAAVLSAVPVSDAKRLTEECRQAILDHLIESDDQVPE